MRRRTLLVAFGAFAACGEPYEGEIPISSPDRDAGGDDARFDAASNEDAVADSGPTDAGSDGDLCDRDHDGFREKSDACGGNDCDDDDSRANPDAGIVNDKPTTKTNGDWNCDGIVTRTETNDSVTCTNLSAIGNCAGIEGYAGPAPPPCGEKGTYNICKVSLASCVVDKTEQRVQGCK